MASARELEGDYLPIAEHALVGDLHTIALVGTNGTIDWYCCPSFDAPSVFGSILDKDKGGFYALRPDCEDWDAKQLYLPDTNVLITRFFTEDGVAEEYTVPGLGLHTTIRLARHGAQAGVLGAAMVAAHEEEGK